MTAQRFWTPQSDDSIPADYDEVMADLRADEDMAAAAEVAALDGYVPAACPGGCGADLHVDYCECSAHNPAYWGALQDAWSQRDL